jgi:hypothetical protein
MVKDFAAATSCPAFRNAILPRRLDARPLGFQTCCLQKHGDISVEFRVAIQNHVPIGASFWKGFAELLHDPLGSRMSGNVDVEDLATPVLDDEKAVEQLKRQRRHGEEVEGDDYLAVILEKRQPPLVRITTASNSS